MSDWVININAELNNHRGAQSQEEQRRKKRSIYKLSPLISDLNKKAYRPQAVSFGPYHYGQPHLKSMEDHKQRALLHVLDKSHVSLGTILDSIVKMAQELKDSYDSLEQEWQDNTEKFVQLMIMDGCFMLELLRVAYQSENYYSNNDHVFSRHGDLYIVSFIRADMLMLENQLPMSLLLRLKGILENAEPDIEALNKDILWLLNYDINKYSEMGKCLHVLDLYRKGLLHTHNKPRNVAPQSPNQREGKFKWVGHNVVRSATELHEAGVRFMKSESKSLQDITFDDGVLKLPNFIVDDYTESMFLNLLAFERCHTLAGNDITSFIVFMDSIINDSRDVELLSLKGIIDNFIGSDKEVTDLFSTMSKNLMMEMTGNLNQVYKNLINYNNTPWHNCLSKLTNKSCKEKLTNKEMPRLNNPDNGRSLEEEMGRVKSSIYKIPPFISNINKKAYQPRVVSFGPYHHGEPHLASMEAHKERALLSYIHQSRQPMEKVFDFVAEMAEELKDSYASLDSKWQDNTKKFVQLMILDGCFMLELLQQPYNFNGETIYNNHWSFHVMPFIKIDVLLLENQLPMSLLLRLKGILENAKPDIASLHKDIFRLFMKDIDPNMDKCLHVLDLYRKSLLYTCNEHRNATPRSQDQGAPQSPDHGGANQSPDQGAPQSPDQGGANQSPDQGPPQSPDQGEGKKKKVGHNVVRPAIELHEAGVHFMTSKSESLRDITFDSGTLKLPNFAVADNTESIFLNLMAFEHCHLLNDCDITSFVAFMDRIIDDSRDVKLLSSKGIITNYLGTDKEVADLFNTMPKDLVWVMDENLYKVYTNLIEYSNRRWNKWCANLTQTYFRSPWAIISVMAAFLLFSLTIVQTVYAILPS